MHERLFFTNRTRLILLGSNVFRGPNQLGMRVTNVEARQTPSLMFVDQVAASQPIVNSSGLVSSGATNGAGSK
jgi:hypothetical protein